MPTKDSRIPNKPLNGAELKEIVIKHAGELCQMAEYELRSALRKKMDADQIFGPRYAHMRPQIRMRVDFIFSNINLPKTGFTVESAADWTFLDATERAFLIDNPNLTRADAGLPFTQTVVDESVPGQNFKPLRTEEIPVDTENIPKPTPPVDTDKTEDLAEEVKAPEEKRIRGRKGKVHAKTPE